MKLDLARWALLKKAIGQSDFDLMGLRCLSYHKCKAVSGQGKSQSSDY